MTGNNPSGQSNPTARSSGRNAGPDPLVGTMLKDRYRILSVAGKGGMGMVYEARHEAIDRRVAIKMMLPEYASDEKSYDRFRREAKLASQISHPNIVAIHDFDKTDDDMPYLVMDYIEGESLADVLKREGQLPVNRFIHVFTQVCDALETAHRKGIIHRDLKPGNIMLINTGGEIDFVKILDFGVAKIAHGAGEESQKLTQTGEVFGSPIYMSPEQCRGEDLSPRSDIYGLGIVMYETLTGKLPLAGKNVVETITKHLHSMPPPFAEARTDLYIPERVEAAVFAALQKDPNMRQASMAEVKEMLLRAQPNPNLSTSASQMRSLQPPPPPAADSKRIILIAIAVIAMAVIGAGIVGSNKTSQPGGPGVSPPVVAPKTSRPATPAATTNNPSQPEAAVEPAREQGTTPAHVTKKSSGNPSHKPRHVSAAPTTTHQTSHETHTRVNVGSDWGLPKDSGPRVKSANDRWLDFQTKRGHYDKPHGLPGVDTPN